MQTSKIPTPVPRAGAALNGAAGASVYDLIPPARAPLPDGSDDVAIEDWEHLFHAVRNRLRRIAGELGAAAADDRHRASSPDRVLECVAALEQLHLTLAHELERRRELGMQVFDVQTALAQARADLAEMRADARPGAPTGPTSSA